MPQRLNTVHSKIEIVTKTALQKNQILKEVEKAKPALQPQRSIVL